MGEVSYIFGMKNVVTRLLRFTRFEREIEKVEVEDKRGSRFDRNGHREFIQKYDRGERRTFQEKVSRGRVNSGPS